MTFDQFLNRIHLSGLRKIIAAVVLCCVLIASYLLAYGYRQKQKQSLYADFVSAYNQGQATQYLSADTAKLLYAKPVAELEQLVLTALVQAVESHSRFAFNTDSQAATAQAGLVVDCEVYKSAAIVPLLYKELNAETSPIKEAIKTLAKEPANEQAYVNLRSLFTEWLTKAKLEKQTEKLRLLVVPADSRNLLGLARPVISLQPSDIDLLSGKLAKLLEAEGEQLLSAIRQAASLAITEATASEPAGTEPVTTASATTEPAEPTNSTAKQPLTSASANQAQPSVSEALKPQATQTTNAASKPTTAKQPQPSSTKEFKPHLENNTLAKPTEAPRANSKQPTIGKYYQVKKADNIYSLAEQAYASKVDDFADNPDKYIDLIIQANKLPVRKNVVYLREKQVIYIPALT